MNVLFSVWVMWLQVVCDIRCVCLVCLGGVVLYLCILFFVVVCFM